MLKLFILAARLEALTWAGLLLGMVLKYSPLTIEAGVWLLDGSMAGPFWFISAWRCSLPSRGAGLGGLGFSLC